MSSFLFTINFIILLLATLINGGIYDFSHEFGGDHETLTGGFGHSEESHLPIEYYGHSNELYGHSFELGHHQGLDDLTSKPVTGIDHGKGVISYSTTYEFPDDKH